MNIQAQLFRWRKLFWLGVGAAALFAADSWLVKYGPPRVMATVATAASFSVSAGSFATEAKAATFAAALDASGLPILLRVRPDDGRFQVLVGPYVSTEEAERAQRNLAAWGLGEARLVVDDTMRARPQQASVFGVGEAVSNTIVMVAAAGMSSIVFEMTEVPKEVEARRTGATTLDVDISSRQRSAGSGQEAGSGQALSLPDGVVLVREMSAQSDEAGSMRAHLVVPDGVESRLRLEGRRVYVDLAFPKAPWTIRRATPAAKSPAATTVAVEPDSREQLTAAVARFSEIEPFVSSALQSPEADVLAALTHSLEDLRTTVERLKVAPDVERNRLALLDAITNAVDAIKKAGDHSTAGLP